MDTKNNFYELLEVLKSSSTREILGAYENKITKFNNIKKLNDGQINEIKMLKVALYVLTTPELRAKYNVYVANKNKDKIKGILKRYPFFYFLTFLKQCIYIYKNNKVYDTKRIRFSG